MKRVVIFFFTVFACLFCLGRPAIAQEHVESITFNDMPAFEEDGYWPSLGSYSRDVGFDTARSWQAGEYPSDVITLGDISDGLQPGKFSLADLVDLDQIRVADIPLLADMSLAELSKAVPFLEEWPIEEIAGLAEVLEGWTGDNSFTSLGDAFSQYSEISNLTTGSVLGEQSVSSIPNIESVPIENFSGYEKQSVSSIPGMGNVALSNFPSYSGHIVLPSPIPFAKQDIAFGPKEYSGNKPTIKPVSGSVKVGFNVPCKGGCPHIELTGFTWEGMQWMTKDHVVPDGEGFLGSLPGFNKSGAYRLPFGKAFALKVGKTNEKTGEAEWWLGFRVCKRGIIDLGCTAYFMEVPTGLTTKEKDMVITGVRDGLGGITQAVKAPDGWEDLRPDDIPPELQDIIDQHSGGSGGSGSLCGEGPGGVNYEALAKAYKSIESNVHEYDSIGRYVSGGKGGRGQELWGRGLGKYQYMTYREDLRALIGPKPGGMDFLKKGDRGDKLSVADLRRLFPPEEQDNFFKKDQELLIKQAMAEGYEGEALIARVGELHTGGKGARPGSHEVYSRKLVKVYKEKLDDSDCGKATGKFINPNPGGTVTSKYSPNRKHPTTGEIRPHTGTDIAKATGSPILATDGGTVIFTGKKGGYGNTVDIDHGGGTKSRYAHLSKILVSNGQGVAQGDTVGEEGATGIVTGPHLHFELWLNNARVDPENHVPM